MNELEKGSIVTRLLEMVAMGELKSSVALDRWPDIDSETDDLIASSWHELTHFDADQDIRDRDKEYSEYQRNLLMECVRKIREKYSLGGGR